MKKIDPFKILKSEIKSVDYGQNYAISIWAHGFEELSIISRVLV